AARTTRTRSELVRVVRSARIGGGTLGQMLLAVDVGNTQTVLGLYEAGELAEDWRVATDRTRTGDELAVMLGGLLDPDSVDGICLSTTVPSILREWQGLAERWGDPALPAVRAGGKTGLPIRHAP